MSHCCKSATEYDLQADTFLDDLLCGCSGGRGGGVGDLGIESSLELLMLSELLLLMATAKANVLRLEPSGLFDIPPPI